MRIEGRTILITGGTSGIGFELARQLSARGNQVIVTGRDRERLQHVRSLLGIEAISSDVTNLDDLEGLRSQVLGRYPDLDVIVNNAGLMRNIDLRTEVAGTVSTEVEVCLVAPMRMTQMFLPHLLQRREAAIINVTTGLAYVPFAAAPSYSAAKAGLHAYTRCLREQLRGTPIEVVELAPPGTETPLFRREFAREMEGQRGMPVVKLVQHALDGLANGSPNIRPGLAKVLWAASRIAPEAVFRQLSKLGRG